MQVYDEAQKDYEVARHALFFNDTGCRELYKDYVSPFPMGIWSQEVKPVAPYKRRLPRALFVTWISCFCLYAKVMLWCTTANASAEGSLHKT